MSVEAFRKNGKYTDIRGAIRALLDKVPGAKDGIIILFDDAGDMHFCHVCKSRDMSFAGAVLIHDAVGADV